jgi:hypothetical protein
MLALYCRAENNRIFLKKNIELRPGFMAKWIEYNCIKEAVVESPEGVDK